MTSHQAQTSQAHTATGVTHMASKIVAEYSWESDPFTHHADTAAHTVWRQAVEEIADKAREAAGERQSH